MASARNLTGAVFVCQLPVFVYAPHLNSCTEHSRIALGHAHAVAARWREEAFAARFAGLRTGRVHICCSFILGLCCCTKGMDAPSCIVLTLIHFYCTTIALLTHSNAACSGCSSG
ncbi:hypothetical protein COO60DRAFT_874291 [Scenedesmus sp. NREL 46B-D3]|nr:hypothetical protein COO60DRAFT_874291 [Scenedesmus sp. NREL 46B-D3]